MSDWIRLISCSLLNLLLFRICLVLLKKRIFKKLRW
uniref:Uncharacterized protein n=1 Tax=Arundo donax TaxID=35708 RepID=A0A0A9CHD5_ARUDO